MSFLPFITSTRINHEAIVSYIFLLEGLIELMNLIYILGRFYKGLMLTKLLFDQLPLFNPYKWPLSMIRVLTEPWFRFWRKYFPPARVAGYGFDISGLIAFESFEFFLKFISFLKFILLIRLEAVITS